MPTVAINFQAEMVESALLNWIDQCDLICCKHVRSSRWYWNLVHSSFSLEHSTPVIFLLLGNFLAEKNHVLATEPRRVKWGPFLTTPNGKMNPLDHRWRRDSPPGFFVGIWLVVTGTMAF